jgi:hypothetical protein
MAPPQVAIPANLPIFGLTFFNQKTNPLLYDTAHATRLEIDEIADHSAEHSTGRVIFSREPLFSRVERTQPAH